MSKVFYQRKFLNTEEQGGTAFVEGTIETGSDSINADFKVGDCNRVVEFQFGVYGDEDSTNVRQKVRAFRRAVVAFEATMLAQLDVFDRRKA